MEVPECDVLFRENVYSSSEIKTECEKAPYRSEISKVDDPSPESSFPNKLNISSVSSPTVYTTKNTDSGLTNGSIEIKKEKSSQFSPKFTSERKGIAGLEYENRINNIEQIVDETIRYVGRSEIFFLLV